MNKSEMEKELANAVDDFRVSVRSDWRMLVNTVSGIMERYGVEAVTETKIPPRVLAKSDRFAGMSLTMLEHGQDARGTSLVLVGTSGAGSRRTSFGPTAHGRENQAAWWIFMDAWMPVGGRRTTPPSAPAPQRLRYPVSNRMAR